MQSWYKLRVLSWMRAAAYLVLLACASDLIAGQHQNSATAVAADQALRTNPGFLRRPIPSGGHLPDWLARHQNLPVQQQVLLLRRNPGFLRLAPQAQQKLMNQLVRINQMPIRQRQRYLARNEAIERLSPSEHAAFGQAVHDYQQLSGERRSLINQAFRQLRRFPEHQRLALLRSAQYTSSLTQPEREMLGNLLLAEPYLPAQQKQPAAGPR